MLNGETEQTSILLRATWFFIRIAVDEAFKIETCFLTYLESTSKFDSCFLNCFISLRHENVIQVECQQMHSYQLA